MSSSTLQVGKRLVELCNQGKPNEAMNTLYAPNIVSIETAAHENMPARMEGRDAIRQKNEWWVNNHQMHGQTVSGPFPHGERFIVLYKIDVTAKAGKMAGKRMQAQRL